MSLKRFWWLPSGKAPEIEPQEFYDWLQNGKAVQVVDARTALEYQQGTIHHAQHAPLTEMPGSMEKLELDSEKAIVVLCLTGHRSLPGTRWLSSTRSPKVCRSQPITEPVCELWPAHWFGGGGSLGGEQLPVAQITLQLQSIVESG